MIGWANTIISRVAHCIKKDPILSLLTLCAFGLYMVVVVPSGGRYCLQGVCGVYYWGAHEHDAVWHLALIRSAFHSIPFTSPIYMGSPLIGYNFLLDLILAVPHMIGVDPGFLYFKLQPFLWFVLFVFLLSLYARSTTSDRGFARWLSFFVFFSTSFGIVIQIVRHHTFTGTVGNPTMQGALSMVNPQYMWSLIVLLAMYLAVRMKRHQWLVGILLFIGLGFKFYFVAPAGIIILWYMTSLFMRRHYRQMFLMTISVLAGVCAAYYLFYAGSSTGGIVFKPLEIPHQIIEDTNMWYDQTMVQERYFITQLGHYLSLRLVWIEVRTILLFIFFNFGIRIVGIVGGVYGAFRYPREREPLIILLAITGVCTLLPIVFVQKGTWWNTIQFLYYAIFAASILTAHVVWHITQRYGRPVAVITTVLCIMLFAPSHIEIVRLFTSTQGVRYIPDGELEVLKRMQSLKRDIVLTQPFQQQGGQILADAYDTAYVSAYSGHPVFFADQAQLLLFGLPFEKLQEKLKGDPCLALDRVAYAYTRTNTPDQRIQQCVRNRREWELWYSNSSAQVWVKRGAHIGSRE